MAKHSNVTFTGTRTLITYDLSPCSIDVDTICQQDDNLENFISVGSNGYFRLPNTTIVTTLELNEAVTAFKNAVRNASRDEKITKLLAVRIYEDKGYIENN